MTDRDSRPTYVDLGGRQVLPTPLLARDVQFYAFIIPADAEAIRQRLCEPAFNRPSGGAVAFRPAGPWAVLTFQRLARNQSQVDGFTDRGWFPESEAAVWVLLEEENSGELYWHFPYMVVPEGRPLCTGREVYGFNKETGRIDMANGWATATDFVGQATVLPTYARHTGGTLQPLTRVHMTAPFSNEPPQASSLGELLEILAKTLGRQADGPGSDWQRCTSLLKNLYRLAGKVPSVFLKQLPAVDDPTRAAYQAITTTTMRMTALHAAAPLWGHYRGWVADYASHPIASDLGLTSGHQDVLASSYVKFDFEIPTGRVLWSAG